jgi:hypothetical protein
MKYTQVPSSVLSPASFTKHSFADRHSSLKILISLSWKCNLRDQFSENLYNAHTDLMTVVLVDTPVIVSSLSLLSSGDINGSRSAGDVLKVRSGWDERVCYVSFRCESQWVHSGGRGSKWESIYCPDYKRYFPAAVLCSSHSYVSNVASFTFTYKLMMQVKHMVYSWPLYTGAYRNTGACT